MKRTKIQGFFRHRIPFAYFSKSPTEFHLTKSTYEQQNTINPQANCSAPGFISGSHQNGYRDYPSHCRVYFLDGNHRLWPGAAVVKVKSNFPELGGVLFEGPRFFFTKEGMNIAIEDGRAEF
jgi:hypothetical protein